MMIRNMTHWAVLALIAVLMLAGSHNAVAQDDESQEQISLYDRLGGLAPISVVVSDFIDALVPDPLLNENPAVDAARVIVPSAYLKYHLTAMVCQASGGPCQYHGRGMVETHANLNITQQEWDRMVFLFVGVLTKHEVPEAETQELLAIIDSTKADIVIAGSTPE